MNRQTNTQTKLLNFPVYAHLGLKLQDNLRVIINIGGANHVSMPDNAGPCNCIIISLMKEQ